MKTRIEIPPEVEAQLRAIGNQVAIVFPSGGKLIFRHDDGTAETLTLSTEHPPREANRTTGDAKPPEHTAPGADARCSKCTERPASAHNSNRRKNRWGLGCSCGYLYAPTPDAARAMWQKKQGRRKAPDCVQTFTADRNYQKGAVMRFPLSTDSREGDVTGRGVGTSLITSPSAPAPVSGTASVGITT